MARQNNQNSDQRQVAVIEPPRMEMPGHLPKFYDWINEDTWRAVIDAVFPLAKTVGAVTMALAYAQRNNVDIFKRMIHIVPMRVNGREVETVWPGIGLQRVQAQRQEDFAGWDDCEFGEDADITFTGKKQKWNNGQKAGFEDVEVTLTVPLWAQFTVYKMLHGQRVALKGPKTWFVETFSELASGVRVPNERWKRAPRQMLEKCAEAAALRRAWPDVFGDEAVAEEMDGKDLQGHNGGPPIDAEYVDVTDERTPRRSDFPEEAEEQVAEEAVDAETGEVTEQSKADPDPVEEEAAKSADDKAKSAGASKAATETGEKPEWADWTAEQWEKWGDERATEIKVAATKTKYLIVKERIKERISSMPRTLADRLGTLAQQKEQQFAELEGSKK